MSDIGKVSKLSKLILNSKLEIEWLRERFGDTVAIYILTNRIHFLNEVNIRLKAENAKLSK